MRLNRCSKAAGPARTKLAAEARAGAAVRAVHGLSRASVLLFDEAGAAGARAICTSARTSAAIPSRRCRRSTWAPASWATDWAPAGGAALESVQGRKRPISLMGDGGFWHNGLTSGIGNAVFNTHDGVTVIVDNGYSAATGGQYIPSSRATIAAPQGRATRSRRRCAASASSGCAAVHTYEMKETHGGAARSADDADTRARKS